MRRMTMTKAAGRKETRSTCPSADAVRDQSRRRTVSVHFVPELLLLGFNGPFSSWHSTCSSPLAAPLRVRYWHPVWCCGKCGTEVRYGATLGKQRRKGAFSVQTAPDMCGFLLSEPAVRVLRRAEVWPLGSAGGRSSSSSSMLAAPPAPRAK
eukprot:3203136-Rhodomonas_salina.1